MKITNEMAEAAAKVVRRASLETTADPGDFWSDCHEGEQERWRDSARAVLEAALAVAPEPVKVLYRSSEIREAVNALDQLNAEGRVDDFTYDEMRSAIESIHDCESATAVPHNEHIDHSELIAEARKIADMYDHIVAGPAPDIIEREAGRNLQHQVRRLADALEGATK